MNDGDKSTLWLEERLFATDTETIATAERSDVAVTL
jgi:hypothetical protein